MTRCRFIVLLAVPALLALSGSAGAAPPAPPAQGQYCVERGAVTYNGKVIVPALRYCVPFP
jgi:hypothetical protein